MLDRNDGVDGDEHLEAVVNVTAKDIDDQLCIHETIADVVTAWLKFITDLNDRHGNEIYNFCHSTKSCEWDLSVELKQIARNVAKRLFEIEEANKLQNQRTSR